MLNVLNDVRFTFSLAVALGDGLFEQPVGVAGAVHDFLQP